MTGLIISHSHDSVEHQGHGMSHNKIRSSGFWIIGGSSAVSDHIAKCVRCQKLRGAVQDQKMADLPEDRVQSAPPFSELDHVKIRQELLKRNCDWVDYKLNVPHASHMGGAWERQI